MKKLVSILLSLCLLSAINAQSDQTKLQLKIESDQRNIESFLIELDLTTAKVDGNHLTTEQIYRVSGTTESFGYNVLKNGASITSIKTGNVIHFKGKKLMEAKAKTRKLVLSNQKMKKIP